MVIQILRLSDSVVFKRYSDNYKIFREVFDIDLHGLEIRNIHHRLAENVQNVILREREICYKANKENNKIDLLIPGSIKSFKDLARKIIAVGDEDLGYQITNTIKKYDDYGHGSYSFGDQKIDLRKSCVMGILNVTEDSFSDGGKYYNTEKAVNHAMEMIACGADIIDIGGESTRPGAKSISAEEEIKRIVPVIDEILRKRPEIIISADTTKSEVAEKALLAGAKIINDISGFSFDPGLLKVVKKYNAGYVLMHMKGTPADMQKDPHYDDVVKEIFDFLSDKSRALIKEGITNIFIDPGIGFGKRVEDNFEILRRLEDFKCLGFPILIGVSRKSFIGRLLNLEIEDRDLPTAVIESASICNGAKIIRTHNVKNGVNVCKLLNQLN